MVQERKIIRLNELEKNSAGIYVNAAIPPLSYSDGDEAEEYLYQVIREAEDLTTQSVELQEKIRDWSSKYHLCASRANLLRGLALKQGASALELGAGCGAITRYLGEAGLLVDAIEGSARRAEIARMRCRDLENITVIQSNFNHLCLPDAEYDYIFLIGVLEYGAMFLDASSDEEALQGILDSVSGALKPGGVICIALENRMGLKYWLGANEDHYSRPYVGLYDYPLSSGIRTYDRRRLIDLVTGGKLKSCRFLYPFPDYKLPRLLLSEQFIRQDRYASSLLYRLSSQDYQGSMGTECSEFLIWDGLHKNGLLEDFANSFLVLLGRDDHVVESQDKYDFIYFSGTDRKLDYRTVTSKLAGTSTVVKTRLANKVARSDFASRHSLGEASYHAGPLLAICWLQSLAADPAGEGLVRHVDNYWDFLREAVGPDGSGVNNFDLLPFNIIINDEGNYVVIDEEWQCEKPLPAEFVLFRALLFYALDNVSLLKQFNKQAGIKNGCDFISWFFSRYGLDLEDHIELFISLETKLVSGIVANAAPEQDLLNAIHQPFTYPQRVSLPEVETVDLYWSRDPDGFNEKDKLSSRVGYSEGKVVCHFLLPASLPSFRYLRLDPGNRPGFCSLQEIKLLAISPDGAKTEIRKWEDTDSIVRHSSLHNMIFLDGELGRVFVALNSDPYLVLDLNRKGCTIPEANTRIKVEVVMSLPASADFFLARQALREVSGEHGRKVRKLEGKLAKKDAMLAQKDAQLAQKNNSLNLYHEELRQYQARLDALQLSYDNLVRSPVIRVKERLRVFWRVRKKLKKNLNRIQYQFNRDFKQVEHSGIFDRNYYLTRYPDVAEAGIDPLIHYLDDGWRELRDPNPLFSTSFYLSRYPDVREAKVNPLLHYLRTGAGEGRDPSPVFHGRYYTEQLAESLAEGQTPLSHYLKHGHEGRTDPNPLFDSRFYLKHNPDVAAAGMNPLVHYQTAGGHEFRDPGPFFSASYYAARHPELQQSDATPLAYYYLRNAEREDWRDIAFEPAPRISILTPVYNVDARYLKNCVGSVRNQSYPNWELCLVDDGSSAEHIRPLLEDFAAADSRIKIKILDQNRGIAGATNEAANLATGEYLSFLDNDDELAPFALMEVAKAIRAHEADIYYSDEEIIDADGHVTATHCKPDYSPDLLLSHNYITHLLVVRRTLFDRTGGLDTSLDGAQDFDMILRLVELTDNIVHIPKVLYHWRSIATSTAADPNAKGYAGRAGKIALEQALARRKIDGEVLAGNRKFYYRVRRRIASEPLVSIIIPFRDQPDYLRRCIYSILNTTGYQNFEVIGVDNNSEEPDTAELLDELSGLDARISFIKYDKPFNYSAINNFAVGQARGEHIILMNNDIEVLNVDWLEALLEHSQRPEVGAVGAKLYYKNNTIQHAGVIIGIAGFAGHSHRHFPRRSPGYFNRLYCIQNVSAVTAALLMVKKDAFWEVEGLDEENLGTALNDVDFCLKLREKGYLNIFTPYCEAYHYESVSRGYEDTPEKQRRFQREVSFFQQKWARVLAAGDPFYNPNLTLEREDFSLKVE